MGSRTTVLLGAWAIASMSVGGCQTPVDADGSHGVLRQPLSVVQTQRLVLAGTHYWPSLAFGSSTLLYGSETDVTVRVLALHEGRYRQQQAITRLPSNEGFGQYVMASGDFAAVWSYPDRYHLYDYVANQAKWTYRQTIDDVVALDGDVMLAERIVNNSAFQVVTYARVGEFWQETGLLGDEWDASRLWVELSGSLATVSTGFGLQTYKKVGDEWQEQLPLSLLPYTYTHLFGDHLVAVTEGDDLYNAMNVVDFYRWMGDGFVLIQSMEVDHPSTVAGFRHFASSGDCLFASATGYRTIELPPTPGVVLPFCQTDEGWVLEDAIFASDSSPQDFFGIGMAVQGNVLAVSNENGVVYFFELGQLAAEGGGGAAAGGGTNGGAGEATGNDAGNSATGGHAGTGNAGAGDAGTGNASAGDAGTGGVTLGEPGGASGQGSGEPRADAGRGGSGLISGSASGGELGASGGPLGSEGGQAGASGVGATEDAGCTCSAGGTPGAPPVSLALLGALAALFIRTRRAPSAQRG